MLVLGLVACTKPNPRSCADGTCTDPEFPFCDVGGELEGTPQTCIAVACDPGTLQSCRGDQEVRCNTEGTSFDLIQCDLGCDDGVGCRLCEPNETACTNGKVATCDASGVVVATESCALGCFEDEPRCRELVASNELSQFVDLVPDPIDLVFTGGSINTDTGQVQIGGSTVILPTFNLSAPAGGSNVRVFVVKTLRIDQPVSIDGSSAVAFVATGDISINARVQLGRGMGAFNVLGCTGGAGRYLDQPNGLASAIAGGGGGGFATAGGKGGDVVGKVVGGVGGSVSGSPTLIPLRGGCWGGAQRLQGAGGADFFPVTPGGGAIQLVSGTRIEILDVIDADGETGDFEQITNDGGGFFGGGAGGGILLEAPIVLLGDQAALLARGGGGGGGAFIPDVDSMLPLPGLGGGGNGAAPGFDAEAGGDVTYNTGFATAGAGGGGGMGRIRVNTQDATFEQAASTIIAGSLTVGTVKTQ